MRVSSRRFLALGSAVALGAIAVAVGADRVGAVPVAQTVFATATGPGGGPHVKVFAQNGSQHGSFFAYGTTFQGGVNVALGDLNGDDRLEVITGAGPGGGPHVRVFSDRGAPLDVWSPGFVYPSNFSGGVNVAASDVNGDGDDELIVAPHSGGGPHVKIYDIVNNAPSLLGQFFAYNTAFLGGVSLTNVESTDGVTFAVAPGPGGGPHVKACNLNGCNNGFFAYASGYRGGVSITNVATEEGDFLVTGSMGSAGHVKVFEIDGTDAEADFFAFPNTNNGVSIAGVDDPDNPNAVVVAPWRNVGTVQGRDGEGTATPLTLNPYPGFGGGIRVAAEFGLFDENPPVPTTTSTSTTSTTSTSTTTTSTTSTTTSTTTPTT